MEMILLVLALVLMIGAIVALLAIAFDWHAAAPIKMMWRWWTVRIQTVSALLTGWLFFDPQAMLAAFNLLPGHVRSAMPESVATAISWIGGILFVINLMTIVARGVAQPKARK